ncbi:uncharacterized protein BYT42DRAFT_359999 [Radiomyces spectabilis]|uniref:uncharacterized protein n=1 Tax=Radiomyces spectabilis TaxID=64574 RepID=UPI00221F994F|nr:uncharacterized protein BYT42DRAFT_359999 [Radiomyces spectabilis]KAI8377861.1 hypothetical protein BYT42DRAFT_359999 [Radiomyces spectabilis]
MDPLEKEQTEPVHWNKQDNDQAWRDPAMWSVVPFTPKETITPPPGNWRENERITVTAWRDPDDPTQRMKLSSIPTGLRPPFWDFAFAPVFLQSLLHVSFFRYLLMSYRPVPDAWGSPLSYWRGAGEAIPIRTFHPTEDPSQGAFTLEPRISSTDHPNSSFPYASHNPFHPSNGPSEPETSKYAMKALSKSERVMAELQKLSAFMLLTKRRYANVSHLTQALNDQVMSSSWGQYSDRSVEEFLDALFQCLEECYANGKPAVETRFRDLLRLRAQVRYPYEPDLEEVNYLSLGYNEYMTTFYDCLDPLVYENHEKPNKDADTCSVNSDSSSEPEIPHRYRLTTFHEIPPLLFVTLENRSLNDSLSSSDRPLYTVDKTIYMDRYLHKNRDIALSIHQQIESYKKEIGDIKKEMEMLRSTEIKDELKYDKRKLLSDTLGYFESLPTSDESDPTLTERVQLICKRHTTSDRVS